MKTLSRISVALLLALSSAAVWAQEEDHTAHHPAPPATAQDKEAAAAVTDNAAESMSEGTVRKVDKEQKKITLRHGELKNLDMPPMTMVFQVTDPAFVEQVSAGDEVRFVAEKLDGKYTVTQIERKN